MANAESEEENSPDEHEPNVGGGKMVQYFFLEFIHILTLQRHFSFHFRQPFTHHPHGGYSRETPTQESEVANILKVYWFCLRNNLYTFLSNSFYEFHFTMENKKKRKFLYSVKWKI